MAFGNNNGQSNGKNFPTYYSRFKVYNPDETLTLGIDYWNGMMKLTLDKFNQSGYNQYGGASREEVIAVYVSPIKARLLSKCIEEVLKSTKDDVRGIDTGTGDIRGLVVIGRKSGVPFIGLAKVNSDGGYENYQEYKFAKDMFYTLDINNLKKLDFNKRYDNNAELEQLYHTTIDFANAMSGAYAYSVHDIGRYENGRTNNVLQSIANAVGANTKRSSGNSFFDNSSSGKKNYDETPEGYTNIDDLDELG